MPVNICVFYIYIYTLFFERTGTTLSPFLSLVFSILLLSFLQSPFVAMSISIRVYHAPLPSSFCGEERCYCTYEMKRKTTRGHYDPLHTRPYTQTHTHVFICHPIPLPPCSNKQSKKKKEKHHAQKPKKDYDLFIAPLFAAQPKSPKKKRI